MLSTANKYKLNRANTNNNNNNNNKILFVKHIMCAQHRKQTCLKGTKLTCKSVE